VIYKVVVTNRAFRTLEKIREPGYSRIKDAMFSLAYNPLPKGCKKLKGRDGYRIRVGNYRIIYHIFDKVLEVKVINIGDRKDVYK
jgi:mRNA interferase RelE/StbE